ncbi:hypothetical protein P879_01421 [Paragonimus westermani]|uniref:Xenotropic and polytropic retrovirus receptor 1 n=1 Tax=Paragonimus westermani TaxID=34504 RepID=A0A8T0DM45_9TREM|nr:hypothetical protein P879_01421 [Paragonimus westermani]
MRFAAKLSAHLTPEWRKQYIDYDGFKEFLLTYIDKKARELKDWDADFVGYLDQQDVEFFELCASSLDKINSFFAEKLAESKRKYATLLEELDDFMEPDTSKLRAFKASISRRHFESMRRSYAEFSEEPAKDSIRERNKFASVVLEAKKDDDMEFYQRRRYSSSVAPDRRPRLKRKKEKTYRKLHDLKLAFSEFYLSLVLLQNYQVLNFTGFRKILKKHDKLFRRDNGFEWRVANVDNALFNTNREIDELIANVENIYAEKLEHGDRSTAMKRLRVPPLSERHNPKAVFRFGFFAGIFLVQVVVITLSFCFLRPLPENYLPAVRIFRTTFLLILFLCLFGMNTYGWRSSGVNHVLIFEINPRSHLDHFQLLEMSFFLADVWGCAVLYYMYSEIIHVPGYLSPFLLVVFLILCLINPFRFGHFRARRWLLRVLGRIFLAPFYEVKFADFWLADQLNTLNFIFPEFAFFICFYASQVSWSDGLRYNPLPPSLNGTNLAPSTLPVCALNNSTFVGSSCQCQGVLFGIQPLMRILPAWFRFAQCLRRYRDMKKKRMSPHIINAGKYSTTFFVTACAVWFWFQPGVVSLTFVVLSRMLNSTYSYSWDIRMDWGLMECDSPNKLLREETVYHHRAYYYVAIIEDLVIRYSWAIRIGIEETVTTPPELLSSVFLTAEIIRRFIWNFFRLENEHLNNCGEFRAVRDIFIRPELRETNQNAHTSHGHHLHGSHGKKHTRKAIDGSNAMCLGTLEAANQSASTRRMWQWLGKKALGQLRPFGGGRLNQTIQLELTEQTTGPRIRKVAMVMTLNDNDDQNRSTSKMELTYLPHGEKSDSSGHNNSSDAVSTLPARKYTSDVNIADFPPSMNTSRPKTTSTLSVHNLEPLSVAFDNDKCRSKESVVYKFTPSRSSFSPNTTSSKSKESSWDDDSASMSGNEELVALRPIATTVTLLSEDLDQPHGSDHSVNRPEVELLSLEDTSGKSPTRFAAASMDSLASVGNLEQRTQPMPSSPVTGPTGVHKNERPGRLKCPREIWVSDIRIRKPGGPEHDHDSEKDETR